MLQLVDGDRLKFVYWRSADSSNLCQGMELSVSRCSSHRKQDGLLLFGHDIAIEVLHDLMAIIPNTVFYEGNGRIVEGTILALFRLNAFIARSLTCF